MRKYKVLDLRKNGGPIVVAFRDDHRLYCTPIWPSSMKEARLIARELNDAFNAGERTQRGLVFITTKNGKSAWVTKKKAHLDTEIVAGYHEWAKKNRRRT